MASAELRVSVACSPRPGVVEEVAVRLPPGATVADAIEASGLRARHPTLALGEGSIGVWGALRRPEEQLRDGDRVELYRPLQVDPKEARRLRYRSQRKVKPSGKGPRNAPRKAAAPAAE